MNRLRELRKEFDLSQSELANKVNLTQRNISYWEKGTDINAYAAVTLANFFGVSIEYLLGLEDDFGVRPANETTGASNLSAEERQIITDYRALSPGLKQMIKTTLDIYLNRVTVTAESFKPQN